MNCSAESCAGWGHTHHLHVPLADSPSTCIAADRGEKAAFEGSESLCGAMLKPVTRGTSQAVVINILFGFAQDRMEFHKVGRSKGICMQSYGTIRGLVFGAYAERLA